MYQVACGGQEGVLLTQFVPMRAELTVRRFLPCHFFLTTVYRGSQGWKGGDPSHRGLGYWDRVPAITHAWLCLEHGPGMRGQGVRDLIRSTLATPYRQLSDTMAAQN